MPEINSSIEQEIAQLERQLAEKRATLGQEKPFDATQGKELEPPVVSEVEPTEKEILHSVVGEKIRQQVPQYSPPPAKPKQDDAGQSYALPELKDKVQELINLVFNKSLDEGIKEVSKTNNPALIDAFHDVLVDELYNVLLERKKLEPIK